MEVNSLPSEKHDCSLEISETLKKMVAFFKV